MVARNPSRETMAENRCHQLPDIPSADSHNVRASCSAGILFSSSVIKSDAGS
jgi:hypothetical protein